jgi:hypothetical protein
MAAQARGHLSKIKSSDANRAFGFGFWNNHAAESKSAREVDVEDMLDKKWPAQSWRNACLCRAAPADLIACIGSYGQRLYIVPSHEARHRAPGEGLEAE